MTTTFTPENSALLLIDHQVGTMQLIKNIDVEQAKRMSLALAKAASILAIPTVLTSSQKDRLQGPLLPELQEILPEAFEKRVKRGGPHPAAIRPCRKHPRHDRKCVRG